MGDRKSDSKHGVAPPSAEWVRTHDYVGPDRRKGARRLFQRNPKQRLDDIAPDKEALVETESLDRLLRRARIWTDLQDTSPPQRAFLVIALEAIEEKALAEFPALSELASASARYLRTVGAHGPIDSELLAEAILEANNIYSLGPTEGEDDDLLIRLQSATLA